MCNESHSTNKPSHVALAMSWSPSPSRSRGRILALFEYETLGRWALGGPGQDANKTDE